MFEKQLIAEHAVCRILAMSDTLSDAAPKIIQATCESLDWDFGEVWVVDRNANLLRCVEVWPSPKVEFPAFVQDTQQGPFQARLRPRSPRPSRKVLAGQHLSRRNLVLPSTMRKLESVEK